MFDNSDGPTRTSMDTRKHPHETDQQYIDRLIRMFEAATLDYLAKATGSRGYPGGNSREGDIHLPLPPSGPGRS